MTKKNEIEVTSTIESLTIQQAVRKLALANGISEKKLDQSFEASYLPEKGTFTGYKVAQENTEMVHLRMICSDGSTISVGTLKALAFKGDPALAKYSTVKNEKSPMFNKWVLKGSESINPQFGGKIEDVVALLMNKNFEAIPTSNTYTLEYSKAGYATEALAKRAIVPKKYYEVKIVD